ncbi:MAG: recombinase family protein [Acetobacteraceae bacterium]|nr:recombinase family protein [Acetobacteraceae bacterium]MBV8588554.1 recombinase family protein [Acetobacteraceae bacterium]
MHELEEKVSRAGAERQIYDFVDGHQRGAADPPGSSQQGRNGDSLRIRSGLTDGQLLEPQLQAFRKAGWTALTEEHASGADRSRPELVCLLRRLCPGDAIVAMPIDRLARALAPLLDARAGPRGRCAVPFAFRPDSTPSAL